MELSVLQEQTEARYHVHPVEQEKKPAHLSEGCGELIPGEVGYGARGQRLVISQSIQPRVGQDELREMYPVPRFAWTASNLYFTSKTRLLLL